MDFVLRGGGVMGGWGGGGKLINSGGGGWEIVPGGGGRPEKFSDLGCRSVWGPGLAVPIAVCGSFKGPPILTRIMPRILSIARLDMWARHYRVLCKIFAPILTRPMQRFTLKP